MTAARRPLIAGNWKMNCQKMDGLSLAGRIVEGHKEIEAPKFEMLLCPPFTLISMIEVLASRGDVEIGGQDCSPHDNGAHTGDISATMLADAGCAYVIVGHSERRTDHGETDELVQAKAAATQAAGMAAIICIGETEDERDAGNTLDVVKGQLKGSLPDAANATNTVIAYEPVWAIGTGRTPTVDEVQEVHAVIRQQLASLMGVDEAERTRILYGGSMKPGNAKELLALEDVDGGLIGGASLDAHNFFAIAQSCP
jgi:triosephosphate isomerase